MGVGGWGSGSFNDFSVIFQRIVNYLSIIFQLFFNYFSILPYSSQVRRETCIFCQLFFNSPRAGPGPGLAQARTGSMPGPGPSRAQANLPIAPRPTNEYRHLPAPLPPRPRINEIAQQKTAAFETPVLGHDLRRGPCRASVLGRGVECGAFRAPAPERGVRFRVFGVPASGRGVECNVFGASVGRAGVCCFWGPGLGRGLEGGAFGARARGRGVGRAAFGAPAWGVAGDAMLLGLRPWSVGVDALGVPVLAGCGDDGGGSGRRVRGWPRAAGFFSGPGRDPMCGRGFGGETAAPLARRRGRPLRSWLVSRAVGSGGHGCPLVRPSCLQCLQKGGKVEYRREGVEQILLELLRKNNEI